MAKSVDVKVMCPGALRSAQNNQMVRLSGWYSGGRHWPVGESVATLDEDVAAKMQGEVKRGESVLKIACSLPYEQLDEITK